MVNADIEFYLDSYLPNIIFSSTSIARNKNKLCALKIKNSVIIKLTIPSIDRISHEDLSTIIERHLPILDLGTTTGTPSFEIINFVYEQLEFYVYVKFYKTKPKPFDCAEFILDKLNTDIKLKSMLDLLQNEPENLIKSKMNGIYYHKDNKTGRLLSCTRKLVIDHSAYSYVTIENHPYDNINSILLKNHLRVIGYQGGIIYVALI